MANNDSISYPSEITIHINEKPVIVKKLGLITYAKMSTLVKELLISVFELLQSQAETMEQLNLQPGQKNLSVADLIAKLIEKNVEQVVHLINICIPELDVKYIENEVGLDDALTIFDAILKVNNINKVIEEVKKLTTNLIGTGIPK
jgi:hypothetical protein